MEKPLISFIITYYNEPTDLLTEALESVLSLPLTKSEREIIIVDDGSRQSPVEALKKYLDEVVYLRQQNSGVSAARNFGLQVAKGEYVQFIDGDDALLEQAYGYCLAVLKSERPDVLLFQSAKTKNPEPVEMCYQAAVDGSHYIRHNNLRAAVWGYIFKPAVLLHLRFTPGIAYSEDEEFTPQLLLRSESVIETNAVAYFYRKRNASATERMGEKTIQKRLNDTEHVLLGLYDVASSLSYANRKAMERRIAQLTMDYIYNIMALSGKASELEERTKRLRKSGLLPLKKARYTKKYVLFSHIVNHKLLLLGLNFLIKSGIVRHQN